MTFEQWKYACPNGHTSYRNRSYYIYCKRCRENGKDQFRFVQKLNRESGKLESVEGSPSNRLPEVEEIPKVTQ